MSRSAGTDAHSVLQLCSCFFLYEFVQRGIPPSRSTAAPKCITGPETRTSARHMACKGLAHGVSRQCMTHTRPLRVAAVQHRGAILSRDALCGFHTASSRLGARSRRFTAAAAQQDTPASAAEVSQQQQEQQQPPGGPQQQQPSWRWEDSPDAVWAYGAFFGTLLLGNLPVLQQYKEGDLPYFIGLAVLTIYIGAHRGLTTRSRQQITLKEGVLAPFAASASLFGLYLLIKYLPNFSIQTLIDVYFWLLGSYAIGGALVPIARQISGPAGKPSLVFNPPEGWLLDDAGESLTRVEVAPSDIVAVAAALGLATAELLGHHTNFTLNNMVACLVATDILQLVGLRSFRATALLLAGLLTYDAFWVFGSPAVVGDNVMLTVATSNVITGPTRLLFPRLPGGMGEAADFPFSLLGLGDIAIPGFLACLALRYDASRSTDMRSRAMAAAAALTGAMQQLEPGTSSKQAATAGASAAEAAFDKVADQELAQRERTLGSSASSSSSSSDAGSTGSSRDSNSSSSSGGGDGSHQPSMPVSDAALQQRAYFTPVVGAYVVGLLAAFAANSITHLGQPALVYIVPSTLFAVFLTGLSRGELSRLWTYTDVPTYGVGAALAKAAQHDDSKQ